MTFTIIKKPFFVCFNKTDLPLKITLFVYVCSFWVAYYWSSSRYSQEWIQILRAVFLFKLCCPSLLNLKRRERAESTQSECTFLDFTDP